MCFIGKRKGDTDMDILRDNIVEESAITNIDWLRTHTPYTKDNKETRVNSVEFEVRHNGIEKLERNIDCDTEYIMCFVHFNHNTKEREGIYFSVWDFGGLEDSPITVDLDETETEMLYSYALEKIKLKANILKNEAEVRPKELRGINSKTSKNKIEEIER